MNLSAKLGWICTMVLAWSVIHALCGAVLWSECRDREAKLAIRYASYVAITGTILAVLAIITS